MRTLDTGGPPVSTTLAAVNPGLCRSGPSSPQVNPNLMESNQLLNEDIATQSAIPEAEQLQSNMTEDELLKSSSEETDLDDTNRQQQQVTDPTELLEAVEKLRLRGESRIKLSGAGRKRFKWLLKQGVPAEEARKEARQPLERSTKRPRSEESTPEVIQTGKKAKVTEAGSQVRTDQGGTSGTQPSQESGHGGQPQEEPKRKAIDSFKEALQSFKVGIMLHSYPEENLTNEQMNLIQAAILDKVVEKEGGPHPHFNTIAYRPGWLSISCADKDTSGWLMSVAGSLQPWEGARLRAVEEKNLPRSKILSVYLPNSSSDATEKILKLIKAQNSCLETAEWRVVKRSDEGTAVHLLMSVDLASIQRLKKEDYKIFFKFGKVTLHDRSSKPKKPVKQAEKKAAGTSTTTPVTHHAAQGREEATVEAESKPTTSRAVAKKRPPRSQPNPRPVGHRRQHHSDLVPPPRSYRPSKGKVYKQLQKPRK